MEVEDKELLKVAGTSVQDINKFIKSYEMTQKMMKQVKQGKGGINNLLKNFDPSNFKM